MTDRERSKVGCRTVAGICSLAIAALLGLVATLMLIDTVGSDEVMAELGILIGVITAVVALVAMATGAVLLLLR